MCVAEHRPQPLELTLHHLHPKYLGGPTNGVLVALCPSSHVSVHEVLRTLIVVGPMPYRLALQQWPGLNRYVHALAHEGYRAWHAAQDVA